MFLTDTHAPTSSCNVGSPVNVASTCTDSKLDNTRNKNNTGSSSVKVEDVSPSPPISVSQGVVMLGGLVAITPLLMLRHLDVLPTGLVTMTLHRWEKCSAIGVAIPL
jgi:hypothetical protein